MLFKHNTSYTVSTYVHHGIVREKLIQMGKLTISCSGPGMVCENKYEGHAVVTAFLVRERSDINWDCNSRASSTASKESSAGSKTSSSSIIAS